MSLPITRAEATFEHDGFMVTVSARGMSYTCEHLDDPPYTAEAIRRQEDHALTLLNMCAEKNPDNLMNFADNRSGGDL